MPTYPLTEGLNATPANVKNDGSGTGNIQLQIPGARVDTVKVIERVSLNISVPSIGANAYWMEVVHNGAVLDQVTDPNYGGFVTYFVSTLSSILLVPALVQPGDTFGVGVHFKNNGAPWTSVDVVIQGSATGRLVHK